ncbi:cyclic nucleotide-binding/CBS domain-containing protein [Roseospira marina]|uniref:Cyclic nucleotide-binding/CBS domain-containing protein n=1 Tax=Roseospira marina TaxID=140057 RepID=A0A5M6IC50_9PROT|nr:putative nucleotidyltransferase substrate binding domain-containing protein [Roseospira marina]KAA5605826.1 cyclic nucleotide-binding/CBS domain-containing protein [Roseospira marina]MBB4313645.1 CBS domain-containing protein [Roseospira marina]MBB5086807.1 CBS domain-containing protein [Roseospira marina]
MDVELIEIREFIARHHPFDMLPERALDQATGSLRGLYARRGKRLYQTDDAVECLYIVRTGALETRNPSGELLARVGEGETVGAGALLHNGRAINTVEAIEDSLLYAMPAETFHALRTGFKHFAYFFQPAGGDRLRTGRAVAGQAHGHHDHGPANAHLDLMSMHLGALLRRAPVTISPDATIHAAGQRMSEQGVSCLMVVDPSDDAGHPAGILTDRDLRHRVVAKALPYDTPVSQVMTPDPLVLDADDYLFDAMLLMTRHNIRHLPVLRDGALAGVITNTNLVQTQNTSAVYLVGDIFKRDTPEGMRDALDMVPDLILQLVETGASAHNIGHVISSLSDAATVRLMALAEQRLGPAPVPFVWLAAGSQARHEQTARSDQDNCLLLADTYDEAKHGEYFQAFTRLVCDGLNICGYVYCPGEVMAMTDRWRQPLKVWKSYFAKWIDQPDPKALMLASVFFDMRPIYGNHALFHELRSFVLKKTSGSKIFLAYLASNALSRQPPLGFFRNLVMIRGGEHANTLDLKHRGIVPIVDLARVYALDAGSEAVNTLDRLDTAREKGSVSKDGAADLRDAWDFISTVRLRHQALRIRANQKADHYVSLENLSNFERSQLKDAFSVVKTMQGALATAYQTGRM